MLAISLSFPCSFLQEEPLLLHDEAKSFVLGECLPSFVCHFFRRRHANLKRRDSCIGGKEATWRASELQFFARTRELLTFFSVTSFRETIMRTNSASLVPRKLAPSPKRFDRHLSGMFDLASRRDRCVLPPPQPEVRSECSPISVFFPLFGRYFCQRLPSRSRRRALSVSPPPGWVLYPLGPCPLPRVSPLFDRLLRRLGGTFGLCWRLLQVVLEIPPPTE